MPAPFRLTPHPADGPGPVRSLTVAVERRAAGLGLHYRLVAPAGSVRLSPLQPPVRADRLWEHTCFEAFVGVPHSPAYHEFNFAPSGCWAAWAFSGYRAAMQPLPAPTPPAVTAVAAGDELRVTAEVPAALLPGTGGVLRLALAAVIEDTAGRRRHWALHHPAPQPDFHAAGAFAVLLAAA
jgi:hypothetical protein